MTQEAPGPGSEDAAGQAAITAVQAALAANDISEAIKRARAGLDAGIVHPLLLNLRAYDLEQRGEPLQALSDLERAHAMAPDDLAVLNALGLCLGKLERWDEAVAVFDTLIAKEPRFAQAHYNRGWNSEFRGDLDAAAQSYRDALALNPRYPEPLSRSAGLAVRRGAWIEADALAQQALAHDSAQFFALQSQIRAALGRKDLALAETLIARHLADTRARPLDQALTYGYLGDLRHAEGRYAEAFAAYTEGNNRQVAIFAPRFQRPGIMTAAEYSVWLERHVARTPPELLRGDPTTPPQPGEPSAHIFLVGSPRSGTTLLENVLISHPGIVSLEERPTLKEAAGEFLTGEDGLRALANPDPAKLEALRARYWEGVRAAGIEPAGKVFIDKNPMYLVNLLLIAKLFPRARILFALRDPRDVVLSCFRYSFQMNRSMFEYLTLEGTARFYDVLMRLAETYRGKLDLPWHVVRNEALVADFEGEVRQACGFIGVDWDPRMVQFADSARERRIATPSAVAVMGGITGERVGQWKKYRDQLAPVMSILNPWIERFGYPPD